MPLNLGSSTAADVGTIQLKLVARPPSLPDRDNWLRDWNVKVYWAGKLIGWTHNEGCYFCWWLTQTSLSILVESWRATRHTNAILQDVSLHALQTVTTQGSAARVTAPVALWEKQSEKREWVGGKGEENMINWNVIEEEQIRKKKAKRQWRGSMKDLH